MDKSLTIKIVTRRLLLRPVQISDIDDLLAMYHDELVAFFALPGSTTRDQLAKSITNAPPWSERPRFAVVFEARVVGDVVLEIDARELVANLGYSFAREFWGRGFATEASRVVVDYGFEPFGLAKICARADPRNVASVRVMEKLGMTREAYFRSHVLRRGERCDRVHYGLLREDWECARTGTSGEGNNTATNRPVPGE
jgi:[ribosomal protein S5]-alanine N-acetyltransferase